MEEESKEQIRKEIEELWEKELNQTFSNKINNCINETFQTLDKKLKIFDLYVNQNIESLDKIYKEKWEKKKVDFESDEELRKKPIHLDEFKSPPLVKILSFNTNYLINLILYCLSNVKTLLSYYFNSKKEEKIKKKSKENPNNAYLGPSFLKLLDHIWKSTDKEYFPKEIHENLKKLMLNNYHSNDCGYITNFILNQLHKELIDNYEIFNYNDPYLPFNKAEYFNEFMKYIGKNKTKISDLFDSFIKMKKTCESCKKVEYYLEPNVVINIYLECSNQTNIIFNNNLNLEEHLNNLLIEKEQAMIFENCIYCKSKRNKLVIKNLLSITEVIIFNINRKKDPNYQISFNYPEFFDGKKIIKNELNINLPKYMLIGVIKKIQNNNNNYIAIYRSFINNQWYWYNNQNIGIVQNQNDIFDNKNACLLIYCKEQ